MSHHNTQYNQGKIILFFYHSIVMIMIIITILFLAFCYMYMVSM